MTPKPGAGPLGGISFDAGRELELDGRRHCRHPRRAGPMKETDEPDHPPWDQSRRPPRAGRTGMLDLSARAGADRRIGPVLIRLGGIAVAVECPSVRINEFLVINSIASPKHGTRPEGGK